MKTFKLFGILTLILIKVGLDLIQKKKFHPEDSDSIARNRA